MTTAPRTPVAEESPPRIFVRDESDIRVLILALSLFAAHTHTERLAGIAESLSEELSQLPSGVGYSSRYAPPVTGAHSLPERA